MSIGYNHWMKTNKDVCPIFESAKLIGDPAVLLILKSLLEGDKRYKQIHDYVNVVSDATLSTRLKYLVEKKLISRKHHSEIPPKVIYSLTEKAKSISFVVEALEKFGNDYFDSNK